jgi:hypothetical protein
MRRGVTPQGPSTTIQKRKRRRKKELKNVSTLNPLEQKHY